MRIGVDTGGTFTDLAVLDRGRLRIHKVPSTPADPAQAVLGGLADVRDATAVDVVHGTTVGINALLTGDVARTAFVTNEGFVDLIEIGRQARDRIYDLEATRATLPVPRELRFTVGGRRHSDGTREPAPSRAALARLAAALRRRGVESLAVGLLHAHAHPRDERALARALRDLGVPITCSAELLPAAGEYERFAAAILNAAIAPRVGAYLERLRAGVRPGTVRLMRSSGGVLGVAEAARFPARAMFSGPAGGVLAARALARGLRLPRIATLDMGGTSTDVALVGRHVTVNADATIAGLPLALPAVDVHTIGCGGGSLATASGGTLRVGPESAGAEPGPACYGRSDEPTVTDAHVALGHLGAASLLGGRFPVDPDRSARAVERLARRVGLAPRAAAQGMLDVAAVAMRRALLVITVQRAVDPAAVPLVAFGGAGGLHAAVLARALRMPAALVAPHPGAFSAVGLALAGESVELVEPVLAPLAPRLAGVLLRRVRGLVRAALERLERPERARRSVTADLRFAGQGRTLALPWGVGLERRFRRAHRERFGFDPAAPIEVVSLRVRVEAPPLSLPRVRSAPRPASARPRALRRPPLGGPPIPVYDREQLAAGTTIPGPAVLEEPTGATLVPAGMEARSHGAAVVLTSHMEGA
jgi:N-methylhydantoinase A